MSCLVSIIVPVYNSEKYLCTCVNSILNQSYNNIEVILIDDGSTDTSRKICEAFTIRDSRVTFVHQENKGVSTARNRGLHISKGEYIVFVDSDDVLPVDSIKNRIEDMGNYDLLISSYSVIDEKNTVIKTMKEYTELYWDRQKAIENLFSYDNNGYQGYLWNKMFKTSIIKNNKIIFRSGLFYNEDRLFVLEYLINVDLIYVSNIPVYFYRNNTHGAMGQTESLSDCYFDKYMTEFVSYNKMLEILKERKYKRAFYLCKQDMLQRALYFNNHCKKDAKKIKGAVRIICYKSLFGIFFAPNKLIGVKRKIIWIYYVLLMK